METFLAYFDILGFKKIIEYNTKEYIEDYMNQFLCHSQMGVSSEKFTEATQDTVKPDLSYSDINCLHISDSILFWTNDCEPKSFNKIIECSWRFLNYSMKYNFPVRGCIVAGNIEYKHFTISSDKKIIYNNSSLYGQGLIDAYYKAESQDWAGCFIDKSAINKVETEVIDNFINKKKVAYYSVPFKNDTNYEYVLRTTDENINDVYFKTLACQVEKMFTAHCKEKQLPYDIKRKMLNTIKFLDSFRDNSNF